MTAAIGAKNLEHQWRVTGHVGLDLNKVRLEVYRCDLAHQNLIVLRMIASLDGRARLMLLTLLVSMMRLQGQEHSSERQDCYTD